jgi:hypothetical protein
MSYPRDLSDSNNLRDLLNKKEYAQLKLPSSVGIFDAPQEINDLFLDKLISQSRLLIPQSYQLFVRNFSNPETPYTRILVSHSVGAGKTITALLTAKKFIEYYQREHVRTEIGGISNTPMVFIIGFSKNIFQRELLRRPEFGFITKEEIIEWNRLRYLAETGAQSDKEGLSEFESRIKKRLSRKNRGGFFKFYGYKEFFNRLFIFSDDALKDLKDAPQNATSAVITPIDDEEIHESKMVDEDLILDGLAKGTIKLNMELVDSMANGYVIADEIHRVYNSSEINNYGIALRTVGNIYDIPDIFNKIVSLEGTTSSGKNRMDILRNSRLRFMYTSATPVNNSPTEIIDNLSLLIPTSILQDRGYSKTDKFGITRLRKDDFFVDNRNLKPGALDKISKLIQGFVSFLKDNDPRYYPERIMEGDVISIPRSLLGDRVSFYKGNTLPYLKFIECPMSPLHYKTYKKVYTGTLPPDGQALVDLVLPNPGLVEHTEGLGLFRTKDIKYSLLNASTSWKDKHQITMTMKDQRQVITGEFMRLPNLSKYCTKYTKMLHDIFDNLENDGGKIYINHQLVKTHGVALIEEIFLKNGIIDEYSGATDETLCSKCGIIRKKHPAMTAGNLISGRGHEFMPTRFVIAHGDIDRNTMNKSIEKYNSTENLDGYTYRILLGSKIINEGVDLVACRNVWVMYAPTNIPTMIQIFGRGIRKGSHLLLPPEKRQVHTRIYVSTLPKRSNALSYEEHKYFEKLMDYLVIQEIDRAFNANAVDAVINRDIIVPPNRKTQKMEADLGSLYFDVSEVFGKNWRNTDPAKSKTAENTKTFNIYYSDEEIQNIIYCIKRLFIEQSSVWTYKKLWQVVQNPPFHLPNVNPQLFMEDNFRIALYGLTNQGNSTYIDTYQILTRENFGVERLFDPMDRRILSNGRDCRIVLKGQYYILFPITETVTNEEREEFSSTESTTSKAPPSYLGINSVNLGGIPDIDVDSWYRLSYGQTDSQVLRITKHLQTSNVSYNQMKYKFYNQFKDTPVQKMPVSVEVYDIDFHIHLVEDAIRYVFNILTNKSLSFSELHDFYFKMLYYYDRLEMILFADSVPDLYKSYITKSDIRVNGKKIKEHNKYNAFLMSSVIKTSQPEQSTFDISRLNEFLGKRSKAIGKRNPRLEDMILNVEPARQDKINKVFSNMLPIGHFLSSLNESQGVIAIPKIYNPVLDKKAINPWSKSNTVQPKLRSEIENNVVVGYYEKTPGGIDIKFKLRPPVQKIIKHEDSRMIERGSACNTRKKEDLLIIAESLGLTKKSKDRVTLNVDSSIKDICNMIKLELMEREMIERRRIKHDHPEGHSKQIRWFYLHFEAQP